MNLYFFGSLSKFIPHSYGNAPPDNTMKTPGMIRQIVQMVYTGSNESSLSCPLWNSMPKKSTILEVSNKNEKTRPCGSFKNYDKMTFIGIWDWMSERTYTWNWDDQWRTFKRMF